MADARPRPDLSLLQAIARPVPRAQVAYERIRLGLREDGELAGIERVLEQDLAERFSMSRTPIREALHRLALMGFLELSAGGGYVRRVFGLRDAREHYDLRLLLEPWAAALAAGREVEVRQAAMPGLRADAERDDPPGQAAFHIAIAQLSGNRTLAKVVEAVVDRLVGFGIGEVDSGRVRKSHLDLAVAIGRGDPRTAEAMAAHLRDVSAALTAELAREETAVAANPAQQIGGQARRRSSSVRAR
jgi:DNA-binding GntR family transcriptional regulator